MQAALTSEVVSFAKRSVLCWLATVDENGQPNVSPKEIFAPFDDEHLIIANIASPTSVRNLRMNQLVCVSFIDVFVQKGFKLVGTARNVGPEDAEYPYWSAPLHAMAGSKFPIHSVIVVKATSVEPIVAPSYRLYPAETTEQSQVEAAMRSYGVQDGRGKLEMFSHVFIGVTDFDQAFGFYEPLMMALDIPLRFCERAKPWAGWQSVPGPRPLFIVGYPYDEQPHAPGNGQMVAFKAPNRAAVRCAYETALALGGTCDGIPGLRPEYHEHYYGAYFRDLDGNKLCVACHSALQL
jgi:predicted pyridoxine 5'-phosphate oxidase superfamily flavin-nucleotide-binding protein/catechol 2,3-dioxygenase-like lactoylglutathione lyase family enzyme